MIRSNVLKAAVVALTLFLGVSPALPKIQDDSIVPARKPDKVKPQQQDTEPAKPNGKKSTKPNSKKSTKKHKTTRAADTKYPVLNSFNLNSETPYAVLTQSDGSEIRLKFLRGENGLELYDMYSGIPQGTRLTVPSNCTAYCIESHTKTLSGTARRVDFAGGTRVKYEAGSEVEYTAASGLLLVPSGYTAKQEQKHKFTVSKLDDPDPLPPAPPVKSPPKIQFDRRSSRPDWIKPDEVIPTYGLPEDQTNRLLEMHREAIRMISKEERADRYREIFSKYSNDYLAAYYVAAAEVEMDHGHTAREWCDKALNINPKYAPAKHLRRKAEGLINR